MKKPIYFERALFFSWYCGLGDCTFCYMSVQKNKQASPLKARRRFSSIFAEALLCKALNWKVEFISGGYDSYSKDELFTLVKGVSTIMGEKVWLNLGTLNEQELREFKPFVQGYAGTVETVNWPLRKKVCPSKKLEPILQTFSACDTVGLEKAITIIIGLGETIDDFSELHSFVEKHNITRITFYALNPHPQTPFTQSPDKEYYAQWIRKTKQSFPQVHVIAGAWIDKYDYFSTLVEAGADAITKLPSIRKFGSEEFQQLTNSLNTSSLTFQSELVDLPSVNWEEQIHQLPQDTFSTALKSQIQKKLYSYLKKMK